MTLIVADRVEGVPILIGDFMVTAKGSHLKNIHVSLRPELTGASPQGGASAIVAGLKKIYVVSDYFAIGFAGEIAFGKQLLRGLFKRFAAGKVDKVALLTVLQLLAGSHPGSGELIGWYVTKNHPKLFRWTSKNPGDLPSPSTPVARGSGAAHYLSEVAPATGGISTPSNALQEAVAAGLTKIGKIVLQELTHGKNIEFQYGLGAEMIVWDGKKFFHVDRYAMTFWNSLLLPDNQLVMGTSNVCGVYKSMGNYSIFQITYLERQNNENQALAASKTEVHIFGSIAEQPSQLIREEVTRLDHDADWFVTTFGVFNKQKELELTMTTASEPVGPRPLIRRVGKMIEINTDMLKAMLPPQFLN